MVCPEYEDLLVGYGALDGAQRERVDAHLEQCPACGAYLTLLARLDAGFDDAFAGMEVPVSFRRSLGEKLHLETQPSFVPEVLDLVGGVVLITVLGLVLGRVVGETSLLPCVVVLLFALCLSVGFWSYAELRESD